MSSRHNLRARVYIGRLPSRAQERDVTKFFKSYGRIIDVQLKNGYGFVEFDDARDADDAVYDMNGKEMCGERVVIEHAKGPPRSVVERERRGYGGRDDRRRGGDRGGRRRSRSRSRSRDRYRKRRDSRSRSRSPRDRRRESRRSRSRSPPSKPVGKFFRVDIENLPSGTTRKELEAHMAVAGKVATCEINDDGKGYVDFEEEAGQNAALEQLETVEFNGTKLTLKRGTSSAANGKAAAASRSRSRSRSRSSRSSRSGRSRSRSADSSPEKAANGNGNGNGATNGAAKRNGSASRSRSNSRSSSRSRSNSPVNGNGNKNGGDDMDQSSGSDD